jgi:hypothetical protein
MATEYRDLRQLACRIESLLRKTSWFLDNPHIVQKSGPDAISASRYLEVQGDCQRTLSIA